MARDPREILNEFSNGAEALFKKDSERMGAYRNFSQAAKKPGVLDRKTKELIGLAIGLYTHCEYCIVKHVYDVLEAGASREELIETAFVAGLMGGGPAVAYSATLLQDAINTFAPDFGK